VSHGGIPASRNAAATYTRHDDRVSIRCFLVDDSVAFLEAASSQGGGAEVILISAHAEADYAELIAESPAAGFLVKSELSARAISRILGHTP
jgi:hypothetical protein